MRMTWQLNDYAQAIFCLTPVMCSNTLQIISATVSRRRSLQPSHKEQVCKPTVLLMTWAIKVRHNKHLREEIHKTGKTKNLKSSLARYATGHVNQQMEEPRDSCPAGITRSKRLHITAIELPLFTSVTQRSVSNIHYMCNCRLAIYITCATAGLQYTLHV